MKEHPLLLKGEMVRATLEGRKSQTRCPSVCSPPPWFIGDRLWVRETWCESGYEDEFGGIYYKADGPFRRNYKWRPSIHMPRWASRITLEITDIRVERIQEISEEDAKKGGVKKGIWNLNNLYAISYPVEDPSYIKGFANFWDSLYAKKGYGWNANCWVWVREFKRLEGDESP